MSRINDDIIEDYWNDPFPISVEEKIDSITIIYIQKPTDSYSRVLPPGHKRVFKVIFSCVDGKWHKSERIYGDIIPASKESYKFDDL